MQKIIHCVTYLPSAREILLLEVGVNPRPSAYEATVLSITPPLLAAGNGRKLYSEASILLVSWPFGPAYYP